MSDILPDLTFEYVSSALSYDPETGVLTWRCRPRKHFANAAAWKKWNKQYVGAEAGCVMKKRRTPYRRVQIDGRRHQAHRLAYLLHHGTWPEGEVDHRDGDGLNNCATNLRDVTGQENSRNAMMQVNNTSGVSGVDWHKASNKWRATVGVDGRKQHLGLFETIEEAAAARLAANKRLGFTERHGQVDMPPRKSTTNQG